MWSEVPELAKLLREGKTSWEDLNLDDVDIRMKFAGLFHRGKRTPKRFMMRLKVCDWYSTCSTCPEADICRCMVAHTLLYILLLFSNCSFMHS